MPALPVGRGAAPAELVSIVPAHFLCVGRAAPRLRVHGVLLPPPAAHWWKCATAAAGRRAGGRGRARVVIVFLYMAATTASRGVVWMPPEMPAPVKKSRYFCRAPQRSVRGLRDRSGEPLKTWPGARATRATSFPFFFHASAAPSIVDAKPPPPHHHSIPMRRLLPRDRHLVCELILCLYLDHPKLDARKQSLIAQLHL